MTPQTPPAEGHSTTPAYPQLLGRGGGNTLALPLGAGDVIAMSSVADCSSSQVQTQHVNDTKQLKTLAVT